MQNEKGMFDNYSNLRAKSPFILHKDHLRHKCCQGNSPGCLSFLWKQRRVKVLFFDCFSLSLCIDYFHFLLILIFHVIHYFSPHSVIARECCASEAFLSLRFKIQDFLLSSDRQIRTILHHSVPKKDLNNINIYIYIDI